MAGILKSTAGLKKNKALSKKRFVIVVAEWNEAITEALYEGAHKGLLDLGVEKKNIERVNVPGTFELTLGALRAAQQKSIDAVICLGCVIQGETPHFDYICQAAAYGITEVNLKTGKPVIFGVLTTLDKKQAFERAGGKYGNKGEEAAVTAVKMLI
ncbi:MAG TPA: 6,7-dimethyl-8-ribityllumazine synthase [Cyclobacteriaceae bacterium]|nr:6,7-dimethyl-8-ribityllumazine synthase [Cyclobacteriaceae bacterium]